MLCQLEESNRYLSSIDAGIQTLVGIARTPAQSWATNQYEIAQDRKRRKLYPEALRALDLAINGNSANPGYEDDHRFHYLRGDILMGKDGNTENAEIIELPAAEVSFKSAARFARVQNPALSAKAWIGAGEAAYADGRLQTAEAYFREALQLNTSGEAYYQIARVRAHIGDMQAASCFPCKAIRADWNFATCAAIDTVFEADRAMVETLVRRSPMIWKKAPRGK